MNRDRLSRRLERRGYTVAMATDGEAGERLAGTGSPDLILMDMGLPPLDGWVAVRQTRMDGALKRIPIIALTADAMAQDVHRASDAGCGDFDTKPVDFARLLGKIENHLGQPGAS